MNDELIKAVLAEVNAEWLMDEQDEFGKPHVMRHLVAAAVAAERERMRSLIADDASAITYQGIGQYRTALLRALRA
jgi:hypothetical protein